MVIYMTSPRLRSGAVAERSYPASKVRGSSRECQDATALEQPYVRGQGQRLEGATPCLRPGREVGRTNPMPEARGGTWEEPAMPEARAGGWEEQPKEWWLLRHRRA